MDDILTFLCMWVRWTKVDVWYFSRVLLDNVYATACVYHANPTLCRSMKRQIRDLCTKNSFTSVTGSPSDIFLSKYKG